MPLSTSNIIQQNGGTFTGTSGSATLPVATTAGNTVLMILAGTAGAVSASGFTSMKANSLIGVTGNHLWKNTAGGETSFTLSNGGSNLTAWVCLEVEGLDQSDPLDVAGASFAIGTGGTLASPTSPIVSTYDGLVICSHAGEDLTSTTAPTWSGHTGGLTELIEASGNNGTISIGLSVSTAITYTGALQTWQSTATKTGGSGQNASSMILVLTAANAKRAADLEACTGFEFGTAAGIALGGGAGVHNQLVDGVTGSPAVVSTSPRSGTYCLELASTAAAENVLWNGPGATLFTLANVTNQCTLRFSFYFPTSLPAADVVLASLTPYVVSADAVVIRFVNSSSKIGVKVGSGTEVFSDTTVTANQWISFDGAVDGRTTTHTFDWSLDYADNGARTEQTRATATATVVATGWAVRLGWTASTTATVRYDDWAVSNKLWHYPIGNLQVLAITPDPSGTVTLSGTTTNFNTFSNNGTLAAWNATTARNAIDEVPPTIGATADGLCQVATAASDYVEIPMTTVDAAAMGAAIRGVRAVACGWAASTTAANIGFRWHDGTGELVLQGAADWQFDNSTTTPAWFARMVKGTTRQDWTQAKLDALTFRVGFSSDASPAIGVHNVIGEVALRVGDIVRVTEVEGAFFVDVRYDPDSSAIIAFIVTTPAGTRGATFNWTVSGTPDSVYVPADTVHEEVIGATDISTVTSLVLLPDPA